VATSLPFETPTSCQVRTERRLHRRFQ